VAKFHLQSKRLRFMFKLPIGYDNFGELVKREISFVDKTLLIKELLDNKTTQVTLITRPRRFGKTLNLSMLHIFFAAEVCGKKTAGLFDNLKIAKAGTQYMEQQGKYPVIFITFKDIKGHKFADAYMHLRRLMSLLYAEHRYLLASDKLGDWQKESFTEILEEHADKAKVEFAIAELSK
jgi:hypothetical protein